MQAHLLAWNSHCKMKRFLKKSFWPAPVAAIGLALIVAPMIRRLDEQTRWSILGGGLDGARSLVGNLPGALLSLIVFFLSILLIAVQLASSQYSQRIIARLFEQSRLKIVLAVFVFSHTYSLFALGRIEDRVPELPVMIALLMNLISLGLFLYMIQVVGEQFRPVVILGDVAAATGKVFDQLYPNPFSESAQDEVEQKKSPGCSGRTLVYHGKAKTLIAFDPAGLVQIAVEQDCTLEIAVAVGELVVEGQTLFYVVGSGADKVDETAIMQHVLFDVERVLDQDPAFGIRILVDIASRALSPAVNDPGTAALAIDQLQMLIAMIGQRRLDAGIARDSAGVVRLIYPTGLWQDYVTSAVTEIRLYGATSPMISRRLMAMFEHLLHVLPESRQVEIQQEIVLLQKTIELNYPAEQDQVIAATADFLGFGAERVSQG